MKAVIVLAMHGSPPKDFPHEETAEFFRLHTRFHHPPLDRDDPLYIRYLELERKMRSWPRTRENDPYWMGSVELKEELIKVSGSEVIVGFNEFCAPSLDEALTEAISISPDKVVVVTPMMTKGGEHAEQDIPEAIARVQSRFPNTELAYIWPFESMNVARFLSGMIEQFLTKR